MSEPTGSEPTRLWGGRFAKGPAEAMAALDGAQLVVALTSFDSPSLRQVADVMLPIAPFTETSGTFVNCEGRAQSFTAVAKPVVLVDPVSPMGVALTPAAAEDAYMSAPNVRIVFRGIEEPPMRAYTQLLK